AAVVFYLRSMLGRIDPYQTNPLPPVPQLGSVELVREAATLVMLFSVGVLAGRTWRSRWGYMAIAFGIWDIFYYAFLRIICGWPHTLFDWDVLFLLPLPWWGPVLAPMLIAALMIFWGTLASQFAPTEMPIRSGIPVWIMCFAGIGLALYVFMAGAIRAAGQGVGAVRNLLPEQFNWLWFLMALVLMAAPVVQNIWHIWLRRQQAFVGVETG
ncbi:MAG TPA: hypothetical protein VKA67_04825, partial [Verrucomicrobiae bacterium]|nr:hypothetical protein [Verrucomicrobiae bacterium]